VPGRRSVGEPIWFSISYLAPATCTRQPVPSMGTFVRLLGRLGLQGYSSSHGLCLGGGVDEP
jgi:hypothetical protein